MRAIGTARSASLLDSDGALGVALHRARTVMSEHAIVDARFMSRALEIAEYGSGQVAPNPKVGAVIVRDGVIVGEGWHASYGGAHAEVAALMVAGEAARGATAYVTLEPCNHHGKTAPCTDALIAAGVRRVVYAVADPNPVARGGAEQLRAHGVEVTSEVMRDEACELNAPFFFATRTESRPFVTLKLAVSIDGAIVDTRRVRGWLTGPESRCEVHRMRSEADAIAVGINTVLVDDPVLTVREVARPRVAPVRVVFDRHARLPTKSALATSSTLVPVIVIVDPAHIGASANLAQLGISVIEASSLHEALQALRNRNVRHLLVEGGAGLASAFLAAGLLDRLVIFQAPVILGAGALAAFAAFSPQSATVAPTFRVVSRAVFGQDLKTVYAVSHVDSGDEAPDVHRTR